MQVIDLEAMLDGMATNPKTVAIVSNQWGDEGKGKVVDIFAEWADIIVRGTGGANAGHTIIVDGHQFISHIVPVGILYDHLGKINVIGNGVAFDPRAAQEEIKALDKLRVSHDNLRIAHNAKLVLPQHIVLDALRENNGGGIGSTQRGIGPCYTDHVARIGLTVNDLLNKDHLATKLRRNLEDKKQIFRAAYIDALRRILQHERLGSGIFYDMKEIFNIDAIVEAYVEYGKFFKDMITDTDTPVREAVGKKKVLLEGAQG